MKIGIVGGGILGTASGYYLSSQGHEVTIFESRKTLGGLAASFALGNGKFIEEHHHFFSADDTFLIGLLRELDLAEELQWKETWLGLLRNGTLHNFTGVFDMLRCPCVPLIDRYRFLLSMLRLHSIKKWNKLDTISARDWIIRTAGKNVYVNIWQHLFETKFEGHVDGIPAAWFWARTKRRAHNRNIFGSVERFGFFPNSIHTLFDAIERRITEKEGRILVDSPVEKVVIKDRTVCGIISKGMTYDFDRVLVTAPIPELRRIAPEAMEYLSSPIEQLEYASILTMVLQLKEQCTNYFWLNINDFD
ncbi:MAG: FAD-dependent oxidoreductase, partial [Endomicrobiales bacterium]